MGPLRPLRGLQETRVATREESGVLALEAGKRWARLAQARAASRPGPDTSSKATLWKKARHEGALTPPCIIRKTRSVDTQLNKGSETPGTTREATRIPFLRQDEA